jgi:hypothetical protein
MTKIWMAVLVSLIGFGAAGCAEQKAAPAPSQRQVQSDSDRFFDKMKQEERDRGVAPDKKGAGDGGY